MKSKIYSIVLTQRKGSGVTNVQLVSDWADHLDEILDRAKAMFPDHQYFAHTVVVAIKPE